MYTKTSSDLMDKNENINSKSVLRTIRIMYFALILGILSFLAVTFVISQDLKFAFDKSDPIIFVNLILFLLAVPGGYLVSKAMWNRIERELPLKDKLLKYQIGFLVRLAACEAVALFSIVGFLLSGNLIFPLITGIVLLIIFYYFPSVRNLELQLDLNYTELNELKR